VCWVDILAGLKSFPVAVTKKPTSHLLPKFKVSSLCVEGKDRQAGGWTDGWTEVSHFAEQ
jgi:hypothetical protein